MKYREKETEMESKELTDGQRIGLSFVAVAFIAGIFIFLISLLDPRPNRQTITDPDFSKGDIVSLSHNNENVIILDIGKRSRCTFSETECVYFRVLDQRNQHLYVEKEQIRASVR